MGAKKGHVGWNKGLKGYVNNGSFKKGDVPWIKGKKGVTGANNGSFKKGDIPYMTGRHHSEESKLKMSRAKKGRPAPTGAFKKGHETWNKGRVGIFNHNEATINQIRDARLKQTFPVKDSGIEIILQNGLKELGIQFSTHKAIIGQPDVFIEPNVCVFADGDYWHSRPDQVKRDLRVNKKLQGMGMKVLRFWEKDINNNLAWCLKQITAAII